MVSITYGKANFEHPCIERDLAIVSITYGKANATWKQLMAIGINAEFQLPTVKRTRGAVAPRKYETSVSITYGKANTFFNSQCALL